MGPYCDYCRNRCFLLRVLRDGRSMLLATCDRGMAHDLRSCGETHATALNPVTQDEEVAALVQRLKGQLEPPEALPEAGKLITHLRGQLPEPPPVRCLGREAGGRAIGLTVCLWKVDHPAHEVR